MTPANFQAIASLLQKSGTDLESRIAGSSMEPAIPHDARIRIRPQEHQDYREGQVVACVSGNSLFAHRIVYSGRDGRTGEFILTRGDGWVLCDPPTRKSNILGLVTEFCSGGAWSAPLGHVSRSPVRRLTAGASFWLVRLSLAVHHEFARHVAGGCLHVGAFCKTLALATSRSLTR